jgi:hypothetical protein
MNQLHETRMDSAPRLLRTPPPYADESLPGYLVRLTEANHYALPQWWLSLAGFPSNLLAGWQRLHRSETTFGRLAALTGLLVHRLNDWREETFTGAPLRTCYAQLCPLCLAEDAYCDRLWDELAVTVCPRHHVALLDRCPTCRQRIRWQRGRVSGCRCGTDWRRMALVPLPQAERRSLVWLGLDMTATSRERSWSARCLALLALAPYCSPRDRYLSLNKDTEVVELRAPLEKAASILLGGKEAFVAFCLQLERNGLLGRCAQELRQLADQPELAFLRLSFEQVIAQWGSEVRTRYYPLLQERFLTVEAVQRSLDFTEGQWCRFMQTGKLQLISDSWGDALEWVDTEQLRNVLNERNQLFNVEHTGYELALAQADIYALVEVGLLSLTSGPTLDGFADERLSRQTIERLYDVFFRPAKPCGDGFLHWKLARV